VVQYANPEAADSSFMTVFRNETTIHTVPPYWTKSENQH